MTDGEHPLDIHLSTDVVTGDLSITLDPPEGHHLPVEVAEWPRRRKTLRKMVRRRLEDPAAWQSHLDSNRPGERLDATIGRVWTDDNGRPERLNLDATSPDDVDWNL